MCALQLVADMLGQILFLAATFVIVGAVVAPLPLLVIRAFTKDPPADGTTRRTAPSRHAHVS